MVRSQRRVRVISVWVNCDQVFAWTQGRRCVLNLLLLVGGVFLVAEEIHDIINYAIFLMSVFKNISELRGILHTGVFRNV